MAVTGDGDGGTDLRLRQPPACCGSGGNSGRPRSVSDCFDRGLRRRKHAPLPIEGPALADGNGLSATFSIRLGDRGNTIAEIGFRADTCVTLVAYCERLAECATGRCLDEAARLSTPDLIAELAGVPPMKQDRARLAVAAFRAALATCGDAGRRVASSQPI
jgi:hypothetical protein